MIAILPFSASFTISLFNGPLRKNYAANLFRVGGKNIMKLHATHRNNLFTQRSFFSSNSHHKPLDIPVNNNKLLVDNVYIKNSIKKYPLDLEKIKTQALEIKKLLGVSQYGVDILICSEKKIRDYYFEGFKKRKSTDILSFPLCDFSAPLIFEYSGYNDIELHLGDIIIAPDYVMRQTLRDKEDLEELGEEEYFDSEDRGVSFAMSKTFVLEERISLLLVHGLLHLVGYDHESEEQWLEMTDKEEKIIQAMKLSPAGNNIQYNV